MVQAKKQIQVRPYNPEEFEKTQMQKEMILNKLREQGCRITKQRRILLDIILEGDCSCCKEIYYKAIKIDSSIGTATVYRMVNTLEKMGAISRKNMYRVACRERDVCKEACTIQWKDQTVSHLSEEKWNDVVQAGLKACGYMNNREIQKIEFTEQ